MLLSRLWTTLSSVATLSTAGLLSFEIIYIYYMGYSAIDSSEHSKFTFAWITRVFIFRGFSLYRTLQRSVKLYLNQCRVFCGTFYRSALSCSFVLNSFHADLPHTAFVQCASCASLHLPMHANYSHIHRRQVWPMNKQKKNDLSSVV